jgi:hypothetical protein
MKVREEDGCTVVGDLSFVGWKLFGSVAVGGGSGQVELFSCQPHAGVYSVKDGGTEQRVHALDAQDESMISNRTGRAAVSSRRGRKLACPVGQEGWHKRPPVCHPEHRRNAA